MPSTVLDGSLVLWMERNPEDRVGRKSGQGDGLAMAFQRRVTQRSEVLDPAKQGYAFSPF